MEMTMTPAPHPARSRPEPHPDDLPPEGFPGLGDHALLARMIAHLTPDPEGTARTLLARFDGLGGVAAADLGELVRVTEIGPKLAFELKVMREVAVRLARTEACRRPAIASWTALRDYARAALAHEPREQFRALFLDKKNILLRDELVCHGTVDHAPVYPREVVRRALELSASALVLVHNHPSGDPSPSKADVEMTRKIIDAARVFDLQVHDHLVVGRQGTASFKSLGLM
jgi:DNA repair protein RadC